MATIITPYGYDVVDDDLTALPNLVTADDIAAASGGRIEATDARLASVCSAVSTAIRDYCGWHVAPALQCVVTTEVKTRIITLPAKLVTEVDSVSVAGSTLDADSFEWKRAGLLRLSRNPIRRGRWGAYTVQYTAGLDVSASPLAQVAVQVALNNLAASPGVRSESVGQVSVSYNATADGVSGGVTLLDRDRELLKQYRLHPQVR